MRCRVCGEEKLSKEFPRNNVTNECQHPPTHCLRCVIDRVGKLDVCPYTNCQKKVLSPEDVVEECKAELEQLYPSVQPSVEVQQMQQLDLSSADKKINIVMLTGHSEALPFNPQTTVEHLRSQINSRFKVPPEKQQLLCNDCVLEDHKDGKLARLSDFNIQPFQTIHLMVLMYAIPQHFNHVIFDLFWGYPARGRDYLDASCLTFVGKSYQNYVDYSSTQLFGKTCSAIRHSGDVMDDGRRIGHHTIEVRLKDIPSSVSHLYFTLSAWNSPTISHFPNPSLKFFEASNKSKDLCRTTFTHARNSQAVIMCSVVRTGTGQWRIFECGKLSAGNAKNYKPLISTIQSLI